MANKEFSFGFVLSAAMNSSFTNNFAKASQSIDELEKYMQRLRGESARLKAAFDKGIINQKTFDSAVWNRQQKSVQAYKDASASMFRQNFADWSILYYKAQAATTVLMGPVQSAMKFESAMADVRKVVDFDTPQQFQEMSQDILEMSKNIPMTAEGLGKIVAAGGQAGIAKEDLLSFAEAAAKMGVAFDITADQAGDMMAKWRTAFKMSQSEVVDLADKVNYLGNTTAASAPIISDIITRVGPLGEVGGVASGEIAALGASLAGSGIESDVAATGIKNMILALVSGESATKSQADAFASLGMDAGEMAQRMQTDAKGAILDVLRSIQNLDKAQQATTLKNLFGTESLGAIAPLLSNLDGLEENFNKVGDASNYAGSMQNEFTTRAGTTANSVQLMNNRVEAAKIAIGNGLLPVLAPIVEALGSMAGVIGSVAAKYPNLITSVITITGAFVGFMAVLRGIRMIQAEYNAAKLIYNGLVASGTVKTYASIVATRAAAIATGAWTAAQWLWNAAMAANPIGLMIIAVAGLVAAGIYLYNNWDTVKNFFITLWENPSAAVQSFITTVENLFTEGYDWVMDKWNSLKEILSHPIDAAVNFLGGGTPNVAQNAAGGIYNRGAFLTTFAEEGPEAAIPLDGSRRAVNLWAEAGARLGMLGNAPARTSGTAGNITVDFRPQVTIQGNADGAVVQQAMAITMQQLRRMLADMANNGRRLSYE